MPIWTHFADKQISIVYHDQEVADKGYEVIFTDGANVDFTRQGEWDEVEDRDADGVPTAIIPAAINEYVAAKHAGQYVVCTKVWAAAGSSLNSMATFSALWQAVRVMATIRAALRMMFFFIVFGIFIGEYSVCVNYRSTR